MCFSHEVKVIERYVRTTYRLHEIHVCAWGWYVSTTYHFCTSDENNAIYVYEVFCLEFLVCWRRAWYVFRFRERLSVSLSDVLRQLNFSNENIWTSDFLIHSSTFRRLVLIFGIELGVYSAQIAPPQHFTGCDHLKASHSCRFTFRHIFQICWNLSQ